MKTRVALKVKPPALTTSLRVVGQWFANHLVQNVPEELSICEYDCDEPHCHIGKWALCQKRAQQPENTCLERE